MATTANGYRVLFDDRTDGPLPRLRKWIVPGTGRHFFFRDGFLGFILVHLALWYHETVERLDVAGDPWDEWGHAVRPKRGQTSGYSEHAGGTAADFNASRHPRGVPVSATLTVTQIRLIKLRMVFYAGVVTWGGGFSVPDGMHFELAMVSRTRCKRLVRMLMLTSKGKRILNANPGAKQIIDEELSK